MTENVAAAPATFLIIYGQDFFRVARENRCAVHTDYWPLFCGQATILVARGEFFCRRRKKRALPLPPARALSF